MRYSSNDYSISAKTKGWRSGWPTDRSANMARVTADQSHAHVNVHKRIARLVDLLLDETERRGYRLDPITLAATPTDRLATRRNPGTIPGVWPST
jgi:hypothetical protein